MMIKCLKNLVFAIVAMFGFGAVLAADSASIGNAKYETLAAAVEAAGDGVTIVLADGAHTMPNSAVNKNITITGGKAAVVEMLNSVNATGSTINFDGVTVKFDNDGYEGLQHSVKVTYTDCTHIGTEFLYAPEVVFTGCTFEMYNTATEYAVWTYGAKDVKFTDCTFKTNGKAILVYTEAAHQAEIELTRCNFTGNGTFTDKAAVEVGESANGNNATYHLTLTDCKANGFIKNNSTSPLWGNKNSMDAAHLIVANNMTVTDESKISEVVAAAKGNSATVVLPAVSENTTTIPAAATEVAVKVEVAAGAVVFDADASTAAAGATLKIEASDEAVEGAEAVYEITLTKASGNVSQLGGTASVTLPVPTALEGKKVAVYFVDDNGAKTAMENIVVADGKVSFTTTHFSTYSIEEADLEISTVEELKTFAANVNAGDTFAGKMVVLTADITFGADDYWYFNDGTTVTDNTIKSFAGTFDGQGHKITGLKFLHTQGANVKVGLFAQVNAGGTVKNLTVDTVTGTFKSTTDNGGARYGTIASTLLGNVENCHVKNVTLTIKGNVFRGAGIAYSVGGSGSLTVSGCDVDGFTVTNNGGACALTAGLLGTVKVGTTVSGCTVNNVTITASGAVENTAGLMGRAVSVTVSECSASDVEITAATTMCFVGGLIGQANGVKVTGSSTNGIELKAATIKGQNSGNGGTGGFAGLVDGGSTVSGCTAAEVTLTATESATQLGGFVGTVDTATNTFTDCDANGVKVVTSAAEGAAVDDGNCIGGFVGQTRGVGEHSFDDCNVTGLDMQIAGNTGAIGGFSGNLGGNNGTTITNSTVEGAIDTTDSPVAADIVVGGFASNLGWGQTGENEFTECEADVTITAKGTAGGFLGQAQSLGGSGSATQVTITESKATGSVTTDGVAGGFVGTGSSGTYEDCSASGAVSGDVAGGFIGEIVPNTSAAEDKTITISGATATGAVTGTTVAAGLVGSVTTSEAGNVNATPVEITNSTAASTVTSESGTVIKDYKETIPEGSTTQVNLTIWDGTVDPSWYDDGSASEFTITTAAQLAGLAKLVNEGNTFATKTIKLGADIDLQNIEWTPIGTTGKPFSGIFDGDAKTISNLGITGYNSNVGLFGYTTDGEVKNFTLNNAQVSGRIAVGAVAGSPYTSKYTDITVNGLIQIQGMSYVGGALGRNVYAAITNVDVIGDVGSYVKANSVENGTAYRTYVGGLAGFVAENDSATFRKIQGCDVQIDVTGSTCDVGGLVGIVHRGVMIVDCTYKGTVISQDANETEVGKLAGVAMNSDKYNTAIVNSTFEGQVIKGETDITDAATSYGGYYDPDGVKDSLIVGTGVTFDETTGKVTGGTFEVAPPASALQDGLAAVENENGTFGVATKIVAGNSAYVRNNNGVVTIWGEATNADPANNLHIDIVAADGETVMGTVTLQDVDGIYAAETESLTWHMMVCGEEYDTYWKTDWKDGYPTDAEPPATARLYIDGQMVNETPVNMSGSDGINPVVWSELFVAKAGDVTYGSLPAAIEAAAKHGLSDVTLLRDTTVDAKDGKSETHAWVKAGQTVTIDMNGKTLTGAFFVDGTATIKNGSIVNESVVSGIETTGNLTLENMTITSNRHAVRVAGGEVLIKSGVYTTTAGSSTSGYALNIKSDSTTVVTVEGGEFYGSATGSVTGKSAVTVQKATNKIIVKGGKFVSGATEATAYSVENYSPDSVITGGEFTGALVNGYKNISGGTFTVDPSKQLVEGYMAVAGENVYTVAAAAAKIGETYYLTLADAIAAAEGETTIELFDGTHTMPNSVVNKNITIKGGKDAVVEMLTAVNATGSTVNFDGVTVKFDNDGYEGLQHSVKVTYTDCIHIGTEFCYAETVEYSGCTFEMFDETTEYAVWTYGAKDVKFTDCVFNTNGKAILVYNESTTDDFVAGIELNGCQFNSTGTYTDKAAVELGQSPYGTNAYNVKFTECKTDSNFHANNTDNELWGNKNNMTSVSGNGGSSVVIDGKENAMPKPVVAKIGETSYTSLQAAIAAAKDGETVTQLAEVLNEAVVIENKSITLSGVNITVENAAAITIKGTVELTLEGENVVTSSTRGYAGVQVNTGAELTIAAASTGSLTASGGVAAAGIGSNENSDAGTITINGGTIVAVGGSSGAGIGGSNNGDGGVITITGGTVTASCNGKNGAGIGGGLYGKSGAITISGGTVTATGGEMGPGIGSGYQTYYRSPLNEHDKITITGADTVVNATGGDGKSGGGAGIGSGAYGLVAPIEIKDGATVTAKSTAYGAGIGGGSSSTGNSITIDDATVYATGGSSAGIYTPGPNLGGGAGIGSGADRITFPGFTIVINKSTVEATGGNGKENFGGGAGIGGGSGYFYNNDYAYGGDIDITDSEVTAIGGTGAEASRGAAGIGGGGCSDKDDDNGGYSGNIAISGGKVTATGAGGGAGIGGGGKGGLGVVGADGTKSPATITVSGSDLAATGGADGEVAGAGLGAGNGGTNVEGCTVSVSCGTYSSELLAEYIADGYVLNKNDDGTYDIVMDNFVASVTAPDGTVTKYEDVTAALKEATGGNTAGDYTVTLLKDCTSGIITGFGAVQSVILDLNGKTLTIPTYFYVANDDTLTIKDGSAEKTGKIVCTSWGAISVTAPNGTLIVESGTLTHDDNFNEGYAPINQAGSGKVYITGGSVIAGEKNYAIGSGSAGVKGGVIEINGGTVTGPVYLDGSSGVDTVDLNGGELDITFEIGNGFAGTITKAEGVEVSAPDGYKWGDDGKLVARVYVAQIGETKFSSLQEAIDAANGDAVKLIADCAIDTAIHIPAGATVEIVGNGHALCRADDAALTQMFVIEGTLTIDGLTVDAKGSSAQTVRVMDVSAGSLTLNNSVIKGGYGPACALYISGGEVAMNSGSIEGNTVASGNMPLICAGGSFFFNGGRIAGNNCAQTHHLMRSYGGTVYINGEICNNTALNYGGPVYLTGNDYSSNIQFGSAVNIHDNLWGEANAANAIYDVTSNATHLDSATGGTKPVPAPALTAALQNELAFSVAQSSGAITRRTLLTGTETYSLTEADLAKVKVYLRGTDYVVTEQLADGDDNYVLAIIDNRIELLGSVTVTFTSNYEGGPADVKQQIPAGFAAKLAANPFTREGYAFKEWRTLATSGGTPYADGDQITINGDITLYAQWTRHVATVTIDGVATGYTTIEAALTAAKENGGTLTLSDAFTPTETLEIAAGESLTLDLNGFHLEASDANVGDSDWALIRNLGTLVIQDTSATGEGRLAARAANDRDLNSYSAIVVNQGNLTIQSGTIWHYGNTDLAYGIYNDSTASDAVVTINGGSVQSQYVPIYQHAGSSQYVNVVTITGGTIDNTSNAAKAIIVESVNANANKASLTISDKAVVNDNIYLSAPEGGDVSAIEVSVAAAALATSGKTIENALPGYVITENNGIYGVALVVAENTATGVKYETLQAAIDAAQDGETVKQLVDVVNEAVVIENKNIIFDGVKIDTTSANAAAITISGTVNLTLVGENTATSAENFAGVQVDTGAELTINGTDADSLTAIGGRLGAGIGGGNDKHAGTIAINGGNVTATGGTSGAGIGGGCYGDGGVIVINGGNVTANCNGNNGAGIGGGFYGASGKITINDGTVTATGGNKGTGIGSGNTAVRPNEGDLITINGGTVTAYGQTDSAGIGGANCTTGTDVTITGGDVTAYGGRAGAGIGGGWSAGGGTTVISGGYVKAYGGDGLGMAGGGGAGIGSGGVSADNTAYNGGNITITGGTVEAYGGSGVDAEGNPVSGSSGNAGGGAAGIGGAGRGVSGNISITGGTVTAIGGDASADMGGGAGIGTGSAQGVGEGYYDQDAQSYVMLPATITISGGEVTAKGGKGIEGVEGSAGVGVGGGGADVEGSVVNISCGTYSSKLPEEYLADGFASKDNGDGTYGVARVFVAQVGETKYYTLQEAIGAAANGETVTLLKDVAEKGVEVEAGSGEFFVQILAKPVVVDLGGFTLKGSFYLNNGAALTIDNGAIETLDGNKSSCIESVGGRIVLGERLSAHSSVRHAIRVKGGTAEIKGGTYVADGNGTYHVVNVSHASIVTINGGTFTSNKGNSTSGGNAVMIQDSESTVAIKGGVFTNAAGVEGCISAAAGLVISGGTFDTWAYDKYLAEGCWAFQKYGTKNLFFVAEKKDPPEAIVEKINENPTVDVAGIGTVTLESTYNFKAPHLTAEEALESQYSTWHADFEVTVDKDIPAGSIVLAGNYGNYGWLAYTNPDLITAGTTIRLLKDVGNGSMTYYELCTLVKEFKCGVTDVNGVLDGVNFTVKLNMYQTQPYTDANPTWNSEVADAEPITSKDVTFELGSTRNYVAQFGAAKYETVDAAIEAANAAPTEDGKKNVVTVLEDELEWAEDFTYDDDVEIRLADGLDEATATAPGGYAWVGGVLMKPTNWLHVADTTWYNDTGSEFTLTTEEQLAGLAKLVNGGKTFADKTVTLGADMNLADLVWPGIGVYKGTGFQGTFDGADFRVYNMDLSDDSNGVVSSEANNYRGFFNQIDNATVKKVTVAGDVWKKTPASTEFGGALIAGCANNSTIEGCVAEGSVNGTHSTAGVVVRVKDSTIKNCTNKANLTGNYSKMGGIAALVQSSETSVLFDGCVNEGVITSTARGEDGVGGIVGWIGYPNTANITVRNCENKGAITATATATVGQIAAESWNYENVFTGNKGLTTIVATGHSAMNGLNYATVKDEVATYVKDANLTAGNTYLVTAQPDTVGNTAGASRPKPVITLAAGKSITFDQTLATIDPSGITATTTLETTTDGNLVTYKAKGYVVTIAWPNETTTDEVAGGEAFKLAAKAITGMTFVGWSGAYASTAAEAEITVTGDVAITANYLPNELYTEVKDSIEENYKNDNELVNVKDIVNLSLQYPTIQVGKDEDGKQIADVGIKLMKATTLKGSDGKPNWMPVKEGEPISAEWANDGETILIRLSAEKDAEFFRFVPVNGLAPSAPPATQPPATTPSDLKTALEAGGAVKVSEDIVLSDSDATTISKDTVLDLGGKTLTIDETSSLSVQNGATLTINNGLVTISGEDGIRVSNVEAGKTTTVNLQNVELEVEPVRDADGDLVSSSITVEAENGSAVVNIGEGAQITSEAQHSAPVVVGKNGTVVMTGGAIHAVQTGEPNSWTSLYGVLLDDPTAVFTMEGGTIYADGDNSASGICANSGTVNFNGGTIEVTAGNTEYGYSIGIEAYGATLNLNDGAIHVKSPGAYDAEALDVTSKTTINYDPATSDFKVYLHKSVWEGNRVSEDDSVNAIITGIEVTAEGEQATK